MSANDKIIIKIQADIANLQQQMSAVTSSLQKFQNEVKTTSQVSQQLDTGIKAFSWTTFAQGALNASTAVAQLYTSIGNLHRVQYQVRQSMVAVERAEDQLARKTLQLNKEIEKNGRGSEKAILLMNEIETASEQLANKQERLKLAQGQVNDTYILFASNVANSVFGVMQTLVGLKSLAATRALAQAAATKAVTVAQADETKSTLVLTTVKENLLKVNEALTASYYKNAIANIASSRANMESAGSLGKLSGAGNSVIGTLGGMSAKTAGVAVGLGFLSIGLFQTGRAMDEMDGTVDHLYTRFGNVKTATDEFGKSLDLVIDRGSELEVFGNKLAEALSFGMFQAPDLSKFTPESKAKLKSELKSYYSEELKTVEDVNRARMKMDQDAAEESARQRRGFLASSLASGLSPSTILATDEERQRYLSYVSDVMSSKKNIIDMDKLLGEKQRDNNIILEESINLVGKRHDLSATELEVIKKMAFAQDKLNESTEKGNKIKGNTLKLEQEILALKKKLHPRFLFEEATTSALQGSFTRDFIKRTVGDKRAEFIGYQPFRGVMIGVDNVDQSVSEFTANIELIKMENKMAIIISEMEQQILAGNWRRVEILRARLKEVTSGPNITRVEKAIKPLGKNSALGGYGAQAINNLKTIANKIHYQSAFWKGQTFTTSELNRNQIATVAGLGANTLRDIRAGKLEVRGMGISRAGPASAFSKNRASGSSKARRGRHGGGRRGSLWADDPSYYLANIENTLRLNEMLSYLGFAANVPIPPSVAVDQNLIRGVKSPSREFIDSVNQHAVNRFNAAREHYESLSAMASQKLLTRVSPLGITSTSQLYQSITNPLTYDDVDNQLRYIDRLGQISTGATVI